MARTKPRRRARAAGLQVDRQQAAARWAASVLAERARLAGAAGLTFGGKRNVREALGYLERIGLGDYLERFNRNGMAKRIVEAFPKATWRGGAQLVEDDDPDVITPFEAAWTSMAERLGIIRKCKQADILSEIGHYAVILIGTSKAGELKSELPRMSSPEDVIFLSVFKEADAVIERFEEDIRSPRYGMPLYYQIGRLLPEGTTRARTADAKKSVHWSRVVHIADGLLEDEVYSPPRLECVWDRLDDLDKVIGGGSEAFWRRAHQAFVAALDPEMNPPPTVEELADLKEQAEALAHGMARTIGARGVDFKALGSDVAGLKDPFDAIVSFISAASEIPRRILLGSEQGELASSQDKHNWDERVMDRRMDFGEPIALRPLADRFVQYGALPAPVSYDVWWPEIEELDEEQKANVVAKYAQANRMNGDLIMTAEEMRDLFLDLPPLEDEDEDLDEVLAPLAEEAGVPVAAAARLRSAKRYVSVVRRGRRGAKKKYGMPRRRRRTTAATRMSIVPPTGMSGSSRG